MNPWWIYLGLFLGLFAAIVIKETIRKANYHHDDPVDLEALLLQGTEDEPLKGK